LLAGLLAAALLLSRLVLTAALVLLTGVLARPLSTLLIMLLVHGISPYRPRMTNALAGATFLRKGAFKSACRVL
jgi:hypothetical protein